MDLAVDVTLSQRADPGSGTNRDLDHFHMEILHLKSFPVNHAQKTAPNTLGESNEYPGTQPPVWQHWVRHRFFSH